MTLGAFCLHYKSNAPSMSGKMEPFYHNTMLCYKVYSTKNNTFTLLLQGRWLFFSSNLHLQTQIRIKSGSCEEGEVVNSALSPTIQEWPVATAFQMMRGQGGRWGCCCCS